MDSDGSVVSQQIRPLDSPRVDFACRRKPAAGELRVDAQLVNANGTALTSPKSAVLSLAAGKQPAAAAAARRLPMSR